MNKIKSVILISFSIVTTSSIAQKLIPIDKIQLDNKIKILESTAPVTLQNTLLRIRQEGLTKKFTFQVGVTSVADKKINQIAGLKMSDPDNFKSPVLTLQQLPVQPQGDWNVNAAVFDERKFGIVSDIRDQMYCGSCWIFSTVAAFETSQLLVNKDQFTDIDFSEQQVLDCSNGGDCANGGYMDLSFKYITNNYEQLESTNRYLIRKQKCTEKPVTQYKGEAWGYVGASPKKATKEEIKNALIKYGAVVTGMWVNESFRYYRTGVINDDTRNPNSGNEGWHAIQIIGWNDNLQAWLIKNSWGKFIDNIHTGWGDNGFAWISYNVLEMGNRAVWIVSSKVLKVPSHLKTPIDFNSKSGTPELTIAFSAIDKMILEKGKDAALGNVHSESAKPRATAGAGGRFLRFEKGSVYYNPNKHQAYAIYGDIMNKWAELGYENGKLGFPTSDEKDDQNYIGYTRVSTFDKGNIYYGSGKPLMVIMGTANKKIK